MRVLTALTLFGISLFALPAYAISPDTGKPAAGGDGNVVDDSGGGTGAASDATSTPLAKQASAKGVFDGTWTIKTERGDGFRAVVKDDGKKITGSVTFKNGSTLSFTGRSVDKDSATLVWQLGKLVGTGDLKLAEDGKKLIGKLILADGGDLAGGTWDGSRAPAPASASLPFGEGGTPAAGSSADGFVASIVVTSVSVRDQASSKKGKVVTTLQRGTTISVKCADNGWCELEDGSGYVAKSYIKVGSTSLAGTPAVVPKKATTQKKVVKKEQKPKQADQPAAGFAIGGFGIPVIRFGN